MRVLGAVVVASVVIVARAEAQGLTLTVGQRIEVEERGKWYPAVVLEVLPDGRAKIHYEGYASSYDEVVGPARMRPLAAPPPGPAGPAEPRPTRQGSDQVLSADAERAQAAFQAYLDAHRAALEAPSGKVELDLRCHVAELKWLADQLYRSAPEERALETRVAYWEVRRLGRGLDAAFGKVAEAPWGSRERDRLISLVEEHVNRIWPDTSDPLHWQDEKKVEAMRARLAALRAELDGFKPALGRTGHYVAAEHAHRHAVARFERELAAARGRGAEAGDVGAQLRLWQATFPEDRFDPSFRGRATPEDVKRWGQQMRNWKDGVAPALAFFERAKGLSIEARTPEFQRYVAWFDLRVKDTIERAVRAATGPWVEERDEGLAAARQTVDSGTTEDHRLRLAREMEEAVPATRLLIAFEEGHDGAPSAKNAGALTTLVAARDRLAAQYAAMVEARRLPPATSADPGLLAIARGCLTTLVKPEDCRGLRITLAPSSYDYREVEGEYIKTTWWESFRVDFAARKGERWYHESVAITRRLDSAGGPIGDWYASGSLYLSAEILPKHIDE